MVIKNLDVGELWLPPHIFIDDDDIVMEKVVSFIKTKIKKRWHY
ncbi:uncharacterized protein G2W53_043128 [Senna tora]|uniref:Uncharacterized protein n=1 Tax=Senna tora TaxID=362788 RepID=A0A834SNH9_9FABA|nr:uncharacterized protein G2W53_043128 [Senna tora]